MMVSDKNDSKKAQLAALDPLWKVILGILIDICCKSEVKGKLEKKKKMA